MTMNYLKGISFILILLLFTACSSNERLEKRIISLERRVAALETGASATKSASDANVKLANNPRKIESDAPKPEFLFNEIEHDFGTVNEGDVVEHTFNFRNTGQSPLVIDRATASCGCTVPDWPKEPIPVGESGEIKVRFDTRNKPNQQTKTITITANTDPMLTRLRIKGFVKPDTQQSAGPVR